MGVLEHIADAAVEPQLAALAVVHAVDENLALRGLEEPAGQVHQGALTRAGFAHDGHGGPLGNVQGEVLQHVAAAVGIAEGHVPELDLAPDGLPVLPLGVEGVAVLLDDLRGVLNLGSLVHQVHDPLDGGLQGNELGDVGGGHLDGLENAHGIGGEGGKGGQLQQVVGDHIAAPQQHDGHGHGAGKQHQRDIHRVEPGRADAGVVHLAGQVPEGGHGLLLGAQGLGGFGAGDALVEGAGDAGVQLPDLPVPAEDAVLEISGEHRHHRNDDDDHQGQPPVQGQHGRKGAQHIEQGPEDIRHVPGDHAGDAVCIAHDPGQQIAHGGYVIEGEGQGLEMVEQGAAHIPAHVHLDGHGVAGEGHHGQGLQDDHQQIRQGEGYDAPEGIRLDEVADGVALEQGNGHVHQGAQAVEHQHPYKVPAEGPHKGGQPFPDAPVKGFCIIFLVEGSHQAFPPSSTRARSSLRIWMS